MADPTRPRTAQADIRIDDRELQLLLALKMARNKLTGQQVLRFELEVSLETIEIINVVKLNPDLVLALSQLT